MSKILIVHPDMNTCSKVSSVLAAAGHEASMCQDGPASLDALKSFKPEFVLINDVLTKTSSFKLFREIRKADAKARVLMLSLDSGGQTEAGTLHFGIPSCSPEETPKIIEALAKDDGGTSKKKSKKDKPLIVAIDDDPDIRDLIELTLTTDDYDVTTAENGVEGLELIKKVKPILVLCDIDMPEMNGIETIKKLREFDKKVGIVMITADSTLNSMEACISHGAFDYLIKPFDLDYLRFCIYSKVLLASL